MLAGKIRRGDIEVIPAIIWFSDLRGFTQLSQRVSAREVIDAINHAARLESLTGKLGRPLLVSREMAVHLAESVEPVGAHEVKGIGGAVEVFAPR